VIPSALADVNERTHSPIKAVIVSFAAAWIGLWLTINVAQFLTFLAFSLLLSLVFWFSVAVAGAVFPFRLPQVFEASPARRRIAGIPVISIAGLILALWVLAEFYWGLTVPGLFIPDAAQGLLVTGAVMGVGALIFGASWFLRKSRGIDPNFVYREIPPE
jgi:amino acid transporter